MAITDDGVPLSVLREIALLKQLEAFSHKNIVQLYDICHGRRGNNDLVRSQCTVIKCVFPI